MNIAIPAFFMAVFYYYYFKLKRRAKTNIKGKLAIITGASSGIGEACAETFHKLGCNIVIAARNTHKLKELQKRLLEENDKVHVHVHDLDVSDPNSVFVFSQYTNKKFPKGVDILLNVAGVSYRGAIQSTSLDVHKNIMDVNYFGQVDLITKMLPIMKGGVDRKKEARYIIGVSSTQGKISIPFRSAYSASKFACQSFYDCLRAEVNEYGIRVGLISPGYVSTNISLNAKKSDGSSHNKMDPNTKNGMEPSTVAMRIVEMIECHEDDILMDGIKSKVAVFLRFIAPYIYFWIMKKRARARVGL